MRSMIVIPCLLFGVVGWWLISTEPEAEVQRQNTGYIPPSTNHSITPIPEHIPLNDEAVELGRLLFHDKRLSKDNTVSCSSCHDLKRAGQDSLSVSVGIEGQRGTVNSPTVFNSGFNFRQFWDGRAASLEEQAAGPIHNPIEMGSNWDEVIAKLLLDPQLVTQFKAIWRTGITPENIQFAIAEFERSLITPNSAFDRYLTGDDSALGEDAKRGWQLFRTLGCISCHQGMNIGGNMFADLGVMGDYFADRNSPVVFTDVGRFNVTGNENDRHVFKVPSLRNISLTAPYFHDGSIATLDEAVATMARYQLGIELEQWQKSDLLAFLSSLTGEFPEEAK